jgi:hypothetical protein
VPMNQELSRPLYEHEPQGTGVIVWFSNLNDTFFGESASDFDYYTGSNKEIAIESMQFLADNRRSGDHDMVLTAIVNATLLGHVTSEQGANKTWLCNELGQDMARHTTSCDNVHITPDPQDEPDDTNSLEERSLFHWLRKSVHVSSIAAMDVLQSKLEDSAWDWMQNSPRAFCEAANSIRSCISWSKVEDFQHNYAAQFVTDALSDTDLNKYSVRAQDVLGKRKRSPVTVCISDRPKGCRRN